MPKTHFHKKGCAVGLILKVRVFGTQKWSIPLLHVEKGHQRNRGVCTQAKKFYILLFCNFDIQCKIFPWYYSYFRMTLKWKRANKTENNKRTEIERFDWFIQRIQTRQAFGWLSERSREKLSRNQPILRFEVILQHDWLIEQCLLHIRVFFAGKQRGHVLIFSSIGW